MAFNSVWPPAANNFAKLQDSDLLKRSFEHHGDEKQIYSTQPGETLTQSHLEKAEQ